MPRLLRLLASMFATIFVAFGANAIINPQSALSFFELEYPSIPASHKTLVDALMAIYGVRDIFVGIAMYAAAYYGAKRTLGVTTLAAAAVAGADGAICKVMVGQGEWNHWGYAPMVGLVGLALVVF